MTPLRRTAVAIRIGARDPFPLRVETTEADSGKPEGWRLYAMTWWEPAKEMSK